MSRVLLEASCVGTPVVVHDWGLLCHLVRRYGLGRAVDCRDPRALGHALRELAEDETAGARYREALQRFSSRFSSDAFAQALLAPFDVGPASELRSADRGPAIGPADQPGRP